METIAKKSNTLKILNKFNLHASKKYGQNFLVDPQIISNIVKSANVTKETCVIEIGPGIGALTQEIAKHAGFVYAYEIDTRLKEVLDYSLKDYNNIKIIFEDFLKADLNTLLDKIKYKDVCVITNLPYYITSDIIKKVLLTPLKINRFVAMVQKEVALKLTSFNPSPMNLFIEYVGNISYEMTVSKNVFIPIPHVDSAVFKIIKNNTINDDLIYIIENSYKQKRKTILNNLKPIINNPEEILLKCNIDPKKRPEQLTLDDYIKLSKERIHYEN